MAMLAEDKNTLFLDKTPPSWLRVYKRDHHERVGRQRFQVKLASHFVSSRRTSSRSLSESLSFSGSSRSATMSVENAWTKYTQSCKCGKSYPDNCAHYLSNALILGGFTELDKGHGADMRLVDGFRVCPAGRPIRPEDLRLKFFVARWMEHKEAHEVIKMLVYQKRPTDETGNLLMKMYQDSGWQFRGTADHSEAAWSIQEYYY